MIYTQASSEQNSNASWDTANMNLCAEFFSNYKTDGLEY